MPRIACHFPITVSVSGTPSTAHLEELGRAVEAALVERLRLAQRQVGAAANQTAVWAQEAPEETADPGRISAAADAYQVPSYDGHGALRPVVMRQTRDPAVLSDAQLQAEYEQVREWLLQHRIVESDYDSTRRYFEALEREVSRRNVGQGERPAAAGVTVPPVSSPPAVLPPATFVSGAPVSAAGDVPAPMTAAHAGGALGERELAFALGQRGFRFVVSPAGPAAHRLTGSGFDSIAYNPETGELWLIDNKASGSLARAEGKKATALGVNLEESLDEAVAVVRGMPDFPDKQVVLRRLEDSLDAVRSGQPIPGALKVKLKVTNAGGYAGGARNLPRDVEFEDVVGPTVRGARKADIAKAKGEEGVRPGRPSGHEETEAMRQRVGGVQTREPVRAPASVRAMRRITRVGRPLVTIAAAVAWNAAMSRLEQYIEQKVFDYLLEKKLRPLEPTIDTRLNEQVATMAELQLRQPGKPLYGNIGILITVYRNSGEDEELLDLDVELTSVSISAAKIERSEHSRVWMGHWYTVRFARDFIRSTFSIELQPLSKPDLQAIVMEQIAAEEFLASESSLPAEQQRASQRRRDELADMLRKLESAE
jgi:hypothetical protein